MRPIGRIALVAALIATALLTTPEATHASDCEGTSTALVAIPDLGTGVYQGEQGGLYPGGTNTPPADYAAAGARAAQAIVPRDAQGRPDPRGKIVLLSIGMSNTLIEYGAWLTNEANDPARDPHVVLVNGARGGADAKAWVDPNAASWSYAESQLHRAAVTDAQVQAVWLKQAQASPSTGFDAYRDALARQLGAIVNDAAARYPNLQQVFVSPRTYAGYATSRLNPEPYAYETGFADKALVAQSAAQPQARPWIGWGPYLWTNGNKGRSDGFTWTCADVRPSDGTHPSEQGAAKIADQLQRFFETSPFTPWFRGEAAPPVAPATAASPAAGRPAWPLVPAAALAAIAIAGVAMLGRRRLKAGRRTARDDRPA